MDSRQDAENVKAGKEPKVGLLFVIQSFSIDVAFVLPENPCHHFR